MSVDGGHSYCKLLHEQHLPSHNLLFFCLFFFWFFFSCIIKVDSAWNSGNYEEARRNANIAKILNFIGIGVGIAGWVGVGIYVIVQIVISVGIAASSVG